METQSEPGNMATPRVADHASRAVDHGPPHASLSAESLLTRSRAWIR